jgi:hypothetical protein
LVVRLVQHAQLYLNQAVTRRRRFFVHHHIPVFYLLAHHANAILIDRLVSGISLVVLSVYKTAGIWRAASAIHGTISVSANAGLLFFEHHTSSKAAIDGGLVEDGSILDIVSTETHYGDAHPESCQN